MTIFNESKLLVPGASLYNNYIMFYCTSTQYTVTIEQIFKCYSFFLSPVVNFRPWHPYTRTFTSMRRAETMGMAYIWWCVFTDQTVIRFLFQSLEKEMDTDTVLRFFYKFFKIILTILYDYCFSLLSKFKCLSKILDEPRKFDNSIKYAFLEGRFNGKQSQCNHH